MSLESLFSHSVLSLQSVFYSLFSEAQLINALLHGFFSLPLLMLLTLITVDDHCCFLL